MSKRFKSKAPVSHLNELDKLDSVIDRSRYGATEARSEGSTVTVKGVRYALNKVVDIPPELVHRMFSGNKRRRPNKVEELADSIVSSGRGRNNEPALVRPTSDLQGFELIKGSRRLAATSLINDQGMTDYPVRFHCIIKEMDDKEATLEAALENLKREDLSPWEMADQLNALLETGVCANAEELLPHLPVTGKRKPDRTLAYYYLNPAKIDTRVRTVIDEDETVRLSDILTLKKALTKLGDSNRLDAFVSHLTEHFSPASLTAAEVLNELNTFVGHETEQERAPVKIKNEDGKVMATFKHNRAGGASIAVAKEVPDEKLEEVLAAVSKILNS